MVEKEKDIVERLRQEHTWHATCEVSKLLLGAADEIERLREKVDRYAEMLDLNLDKDYESEAKHPRNTL